MGKIEDEKYRVARESLPPAKAKLEDWMKAQNSPGHFEALDVICDEAKAALKTVEEAKVKVKVLPEHLAEEEGITGLITKALEQRDNMEKELKAKKDTAKKKLLQEVAKAATYTGDVDALSEALAEAKEAGMQEKELSEAEARVVEMSDFQTALSEGATALQEAAKGSALEVDIEELEQIINTQKEGPVALLNKTVCELYLQLLFKPAPTSVATEKADETIAEAIQLEVAEDIVKAMKKKNEEAKKAQNAKKIADRKAKKPPSDPPAPPDPAEPHPTVPVAVLETNLKEALAKAEAKLLEAKTSIALNAARTASLLTEEALLDLEERPEREEAHPNLVALEEALKAATEAKASKDLLMLGKTALEDGKQRRLAARTKLASEKLAAASSEDAKKLDVKALTAVIAMAEKEAVDAADMDKANKKLAESYKQQSEGGLEPLSRPEEISHEGFEIIDPLKAALEEARKRSANEELLIKGQAKLDYWLEARARRDKAKKELDASLKPPPATVEQTKVAACLQEASEAKLDPKLLTEAADKLRVAELAQRVYGKAKAPPGTLEIGVLEAELVQVGGSALSAEEEKQRNLEVAVAAINEKIELIKETQKNQAARDGILAKQVKKGSYKQRSADSKEDDLLTPAWVRKADGEGGERERRPSIQAVAAKQDAELAVLQEQLKAAEAALKAQEEAVKVLASTVVVPPDVIAFAQLKLRASKTCDEMQKAQEPPLLDLDLSRLQTAIKACEFKFGELPIAGLDDLDCDVPKAELQKARTRLKEADRAQKRQQRARSQLSVRVNAPTGTATFDTLVKLVAEAKAAQVEEELIARAELKLKKMEELAASSLRAGPLAFISFHLPCLRSCVSRYAISLVEQAEEKRRLDADKQEVAAAELKAQIGTWEKGVIHKSLLTTDVDKLKGAIQSAAQVGLSQELIEHGRLKLVAIEKYKLDKSRGLIKDDEPKKKAAADEDGKKKKPKFKNYGYVKKEVEEGAS